MVLSEDYFLPNWAISIFLSAGFGPDEERHHLVSETLTRKVTFIEAN